MELLGVEEHGRVQAQLDLALPTRLLEVGRYAPVQFGAEAVDQRRRLNLSQVGFDRARYDLETLQAVRIYPRRGARSITSLEWPAAGSKFPHTKGPLRMSSPELF